MTPTNGPMDLLTADGEELRRWFDKRDIEQRDNRAVFTQMRDAIVAQCRAPRTELTEAAVAKAWDATCDVPSAGFWSAWSTQRQNWSMVKWALAFARALAASPVDVAAVQREAWDAARDYADHLFDVDADQFDAERDRRWPPPAPKVPSVKYACELCGGEETSFIGGAPYTHTDRDDCIRHLRAQLAASVRASTGGEDK